MNSGWQKRWFVRMFDAGWRFWLFVDARHMWRHDDEPVFLTVEQSHDLFIQFYNTNGSYIPTPYEVEEEAVE